MSDLISVEDVRVSYGEVAALRGISARVDDGEIVGVIGPNGAGKTTLVETVSGFHDYDGRVAYRDREVAGHHPADLVADGLVHCAESRDLFGHLSVEDNLELGAYRHRDGVEDRLEFVYDLFPVLAERADQNARTMSGGEQQMLAIGRALMGDPDVLLLDEPTLGLAPVVLRDISDGLDEIRDAGVTVLLAEQNVTFTMNHADRVYLLENGKVEREGDPETLRGDEYIRTAYLGE
ncbi:ABC transporter ATP-binding protein [Haladaptatus salinisoli]|uniref:ABC transporter ATP-binding protein n=1 Tax=Haladaptatus salinisoli TaxID=2884876 RepID=UPI001D0A78E9|nr:ABC transporter ATP-binding protein [Haladaptatus salinisoli]